MAKVFSYVILSTGMMLLFNIAGIPTAVDSILQWLGITAVGQNISLSSFMLTILGIISTATVGGIIIGAITRSSPESYLIAPLVALLAVFVGTFVAIVNYAQATSAWVGYVCLILLAPIAVGYGISLVEFWRGVD